MDADFPAAHSMDTHWFAVDGAGQVALFFTAETGFMPLGATEAESHDLIRIYRTITGKDPPGLDEEEYVEEWDEFLDALVGLGFFYYNYVEASGDPEGLLVPYTLWGEPATALHVDQLPPDLRGQVLRCRFESASFGENEHLQPLESMPDDKWFFYWEGDCAYLTADESAVRPLPGRQDKYQEFCRKHADQLATRRKGARVERLDDPAKEGG
jgi:hypothetical protein